MINTEQMLSAGRMMQDAADTIARQELFPEHKMRQLHEFIDRFEAIVDRFVEAVDKLGQTK